MAGLQVISRYSDGQLRDCIYKTSGIQLYLGVQGSAKTGFVMDIVYINDLRIEAIIGIFEWERRVKQTVSLNLEMAGDVARAAKSDSISDTLDYKSVAKRLIDYVGNSEFQLIETLAERVCEIVLDEYQVSWVKLRLSKPGAIRYAADVGVLIERSQKT